MDGLPVLGSIDRARELADAVFVVATGRPDQYTSRHAIVDRLGLPDERYGRVVHPGASLAGDTVLGCGSVALAGVVATAAVRIGRHVALMPNVVLTHDVEVADFATVASSVALAGGTRVERGAYLGTTTLVRQGADDRGVGDDRHGRDGPGRRARPPTVVRRARLGSWRVTCCRLPARAPSGGGRGINDAGLRTSRSSAEGSSGWPWLMPCWLVTRACGRGRSTRSLSWGARQRAQQRGAACRLLLRPGLTEGGPDPPREPAAARVLREHGVPVRRCGKVVVTTSAEELPALHQLHERGLANGVDVQRGRARASCASSSRWRRRSVRRCGRRRRRWPTRTLVIEALADDVRSAGGRVVLDAPAESGGVGWLNVAGQRWQVGHVVNAAGLHADVVGGWFGFCDDYVVLPFKGLYWYGNWPPGRLQRHVYPVPDPRNPFLGVHLTVTADGRREGRPHRYPGAVAGGATAGWRTCTRGRSDRRCAATRASCAARTTTCRRWCAPRCRSTRASIW